MVNKYFNTKVNEILNQYSFIDKGIYSVTGRAINDIIQAFIEVRSEFEGEIDNLRTEVIQLEITCEGMFLENETLLGEIFELEQEIELLNQDLWNLKNQIEEGKSGGL